MDITLFQKGDSITLNPRCVLIRNIDWTYYFANAKKEIVRHAREMHQREVDAEDLPTDDCVGVKLIHKLYKYTWTKVGPIRPIISR
jgi:hypothetical protein